MRNLAKIYLVASVWPVFPLVGMWIFAASTAFLFGSWPTYGNPDPKDVLFGIPDALVMLLHFAIIPAISTTLVLGPYIAWQRRSLLPLGWLVSCLSGVLLLWLQFTWDPLGIIEWYID